MPKSLRFSKSYANSGIEVEFTKSTQMIYVCGWYDSCVGIEGTSLSLKDFLGGLGITDKMCIKALKND